MALNHLARFRVLLLLLLLLGGIADHLPSLASCLGSKQPTGIHQRELIATNWRRARRDQLFAVVVGGGGVGDGGRASAAASITCSNSTDANAYIVDGSMLLAHRNSRYRCMRVQSSVACKAR